jgi:hypothetical protein
VLRIVAVGIEAQPATIAGFASQLRVRGSLDCIYDVSMDLFLLAVDLGERQTRLLCRHQYIEGINAAIGDRVKRRPSALEDGRQMLERFLLPRRDVRDDVSDRPGCRDPPGFRTSDSERPAYESLKATQALSSRRNSCCLSTYSGFSKG